MNRSCQAPLSMESPGKTTRVGCHDPSRGSSQLRDLTQVSRIAGRVLTFWVTAAAAAAAAAAKSLQSCPTLCDPRDGSPPGSPVPGILQARTLEWVAISFSNAGKWKVKVKSLSRVRPSLLGPWDFPGKSTGVGCHCLLRVTREAHIIH